MSGVEIIGHCPEEMRRPLEAVVERALAAGAPRPPWLAVAGGGPEWLDRVRRAPAAERAKAVLLAAGEDDLVRAVRLGFGGAATLPPSMPVLDSALRSAATGWSPPAVDVELVDELLSDPVGAWRVGWFGRPAWPEVLGLVRTSRSLVALAELLGVPPVLAVGPSLLVASSEPPAVAAAWSAVAAGGLEVPGECPDVVAAAAVEPAHRSAGPVAAKPVHELPSGRRLGGWWVSPQAEVTQGWLAAPGVTALDPWRLIAASSIEEIPQVVMPAQLLAVHHPVVRVPAWATVALRAGSPSAVLLERLVGAARRESTTLWVPGVDADGLQVLLRLAHPMWVDGPAVPD